jgi:butyryl-CoA dehydrogenase
MAKEYVDITTLKYLLYHVHGVEKLLSEERFQDYDKDSLDLFLNAIKEFSDRELFPYIKEMDETPAKYENGTIMVHKQVDVIMRKGGEMGIISGPFDYGDGGLQLPFMIHTASAYILEAANNHLPGYVGLTQGAAELIVNFANEDLKKTYVPKMLAGIWGGTMCLTEPQAGSSLSDVTTKAVPTQEGYYKISGQKIFISGGDHQYAENVVHLLLARIEGAPSGTKGISLFVVPKNRMDGEGGLRNNDVVTLVDFQKMGQRGYATTHLGFGDKEDCHGWLVGEAHMGLKYMFLMMNSARISVGRGGAAISMAAYQASLEYANERLQGRRLSSDGKKDPDLPPCLIIDHPDVRRMLLLQKAIAEGSLSLVLLAAKYYDIIKSTKIPETKEKYGLLLEMVIPIVKTYPTEAGIVSVSNGVQVLGGYGFCSDFILQQYYRDIRIFSIYEGTTGIQSQDLLGRKVPMENGKALELLLTEILHTITEAMKFDELRSSAKILGDKIKLIRKVLDYLAPFAKEGDYERYLSDANLFMEFLSNVVLGWLWLDIALNAQRNLKEGNRSYSEAFHNSKIHTMKFYFKYELPKTGSLAEILMHPDELTINTGKEVF